MNVTTKVTKKRKSQKLTPGQVTKLQKYIGRFNSLQEAADNIGIPRSTLERVDVYKSGAPETIATIFEKIAA